MDIVEVMVKEYETLRAEIIAALGYRLQVWSFGSAAVAVLIAGGVTAVSQGDKWVAPVVLAAVVPVLSLAILHTWVSEVRRGRRASWYLIGLERRINAELGRRALRWEEDLRPPTTPQMQLFREHYRITKFFFFSAGLLSALVGAYTFVCGLAIPHLSSWVAGAAWSIVTIVAYCIWHHKYVPDFEQWDKEDPSWPPKIQEPQPTSPAID